MVISFDLSLSVYIWFIIHDNKELIPSEDPGPIHLDTNLFELITLNIDIHDYHSMQRILISCLFRIALNSLFTLSRRILYTLSSWLLVMFDISPRRIHTHSVLQDEGCLKFFIRGRPLIFYAPTSLIAEFRLSATSQPPSERLKLEWAYPFRGVNGVGPSVYSSLVTRLKGIALRHLYVA